MDRWIFLPAINATVFSRSRYSIYQHDLSILITRREYYILNSNWISISSTHCDEGILHQFMTLLLAQLQIKCNFLTFPACFWIPIIFSNFNYNCSNLLDMRNLQEQVKNAFCYQKLFWPSTVWINCSSDLNIFEKFLDH